MAVNKLDPKIIFASEAPARDVPAVFTNKTVGWGESRKNGGRPTIKQSNALQQETDLKILWLNENAVTPYDASIDYPVNAVTIQDGTFKIFNGTVWNLFLNKDMVGLGNVDNTSDANKPIPDSQIAINKLGGVDYWREINKPYPLNGEVRLLNGDVVTSTVADNINNPNVTMLGWKTLDSGNVVALGIDVAEKVIPIAGAIRVGSGGIPFAIENALHTPFGITGVEVGSQPYILRVKYENGFKKVGTLVATPDETLAPFLVSVGGSVGIDYADLTLVAPLYFTMLGNVISGISPLWADYVTVADSSANHVTLTTPTKADVYMQPLITSKNNSTNTRTYTDFTAYSTPTALKISAWKQDKVSCRLKYNGSSFALSMSNTTGISATVSGNKITISHPAAQSASSISGRVLQAFANNYKYVLSALTSTTTILDVYDAAGVALAAMNANVDFSFEFSPLNPVTTLANIADKEVSVFAGYYYLPVEALGKVSGGNIWVDGAMIK